MIVIGSAASMNPEPVMLRIEKIVEGGAGLARGESGVVLLPGSLPGETVEARVDEMRQGVARGRVVRVVSPSRHRIDPACPLFLTCGGCDFLHTTYAAELDLKQRIMAETLERVGKLKLVNVLSPVPASQPEFYRAFTQLKIDPEGRIGLFKRESHEVVPFEGRGFAGCRLQREYLNRAVAALQGKLSGYKVIKFRMGDEGFVVNITSDIPQEPDERLNGLIHDLGATGFLVNDRLIFGSPAVLYIYGEAEGRTLRFRVSNDAFFQADPSVVQRLVNRMAGIISAERGDKRLTENMLDLYAGVGAFGISLVRKVQGVYSVEVGEGAVQDLEFNMGENRVINMVAHRGTVGSFLKRFRGSAGTVIIDPPRAGLEPDVLKALIRLSPPLLLYVSCHPATLSRDLSAFASSGKYLVDSVQIFDQFGRTHHIESLSVLKLNLDAGHSSG